MLSAIGLDGVSETVYREMLAHPQDDLGQLAERLGIDDDQLRASLERLTALALVDCSPDAGEYWAQSPIRSVGVLLAHQQSELAMLRQRVEESQAAATLLLTQYAEVCRDAEADWEELTGIAAIRSRLSELSARAEYEIVTLAPGGAHKEADLLASREPNALLLERGVQVMTVYQDSVRNDQPTVNHVQWLADHGAKVGTVASLPIRMIIFDRKIAVLPTDTSDAAKGAKLVQDTSTITALYALFDEIWNRATPWTPRQPRTEVGLTNQELETLRLLGCGYTDDAIARRLGISHRTARRIVANLMVVLGAGSRFEAGVHAVQDGWIPSTR
ncbi:helix-turn-helix transcriptional regulator [Kitasatospora sp. MAP5-34]|uniref:helix-turn-helix transcriptional regulator n=1 Tax=Kitasatospora sp. MAP5-34 TaxID=3035102 RepID=UPI002474D1D7|nr:helix-turn-helix transcriptional regulator [Kitasatospora sp. MAP5-34]MDH6578828.1 DNA-binding NarL/FixJ family response regulator [Kitasatospora sp. MAP5-34]